jgi:NDP-hexose-3-ketoreductase
MNELPIGVLGCADIAMRRVLPALAALPAARLVAVASRDRSKAEQAGARFGCAGLRGYEALLARDDIRAVYIPLPPAMHHEWVCRALEAGKHVLVEKPLTTSYADTREAVELARRKGLVLAENFMFLHHSQHETVRKMVADGAIGDLRVFQGSFAVPPLKSTSYRYQPELGGGALLDTGVYPLRAAQLHLGPDLRVLGACLRVDRATGVDVAGSALLSTPEGVTAQLDFGFEHAYRSRYALWGGTGRLSALRAFTPPEQLRPPLLLEEQDKATELAVAPDDQVRNCMAAFVAAVLEDRHPADEPLLTQARLVQEVRDAAHVVTMP